MSGHLPLEANILGGSKSIGTDRGTAANLFDVLELGDHALILPIEVRNPIVCLPHSAVSDFIVVPILSKVDVVLNLIVVNVIATLRAVKEGFPFWVLDILQLSRGESKYLLRCDRIRTALTSAAGFIEEDGGAKE